MQQVEPYLNMSLENMKGEEWRDIEGFIDYYQVSNMGNIKSLNYNNTSKPKILKTYTRYD